MNFEEAIAYLFGLGHETLAMKFGLRNTELLLSAMDNPQSKFRSVQIAGTNGKGSTAIMLDSICRTAKIRTGLYTSPHLVTINERIKVDGKEIEREEFARHATSVRHAVEKLLETKQLDALPTFFEQLTVIALVAFKEAGVELAILETGLGGRLDSTTAVQAELVGITPISLDHEEYLGNSIEEIAAEKAATIHEGAAAVIAKQEPAAMAVILDRCRSVKVEPSIPEFSTRVNDVSVDGRFCVTVVTPNGAYENVWLGLLGQHQVENAALALRLAEVLASRGFEISSQDIVAGIEQSHHAGRLELIQGAPTILLDGAHNPAGARALKSHLDSFAKRPLTIVFGLMTDKRLDQIAETLFPICDLLIITSINNPRSASLDSLQSAAALFQNEVEATHSSEEALKLAILKTPSEGMICVTGSLYLLGEIRPLVVHSNQ